MSYDLTALRLAPGEDPETAIARRELEAERALEAGVQRSPASDERAAMERLAEALHAVDRAAERNESDAWIDLGGRQVQVTVRADEVEISIPYHYDGDEARAALARVHEYAVVLTEHGWTVWDPQAEEVVGHDVPPDLRTDYAAGRAAIAGEAPRRSFWQRLTGRPG